MSTEENFKEIKKRQNRKNKKSRFIRNAKGFGKKGIFGRGTEIKDDQYHYFIGILDAMKDGLKSGEDKMCMANNVFDMTKNEEVHLASNQIVSKVLESLIGYVDAEHLERYFITFADSFRPICSNPFASHVLQKLVEISFLRGLGDSSIVVNDSDEAVSVKRTKVDLCTEELFNLKTEFNEQHKENCRSFVLRTSKFLLNNLEDFVWDSCGNHIIRTCVLSLAGLYEEKVAFKRSVGSVDLNKFRTFNVPEEWHVVMKEFPERLGMWPHFPDFPYDENSSGLLCSICIALNAVDKTFLKHFGKNILIKSFLVAANENDKKEKDEIMDINQEEANADKTNVDKEATIEPNKLSKLPPVFQQNTSVILLETLLNVAGPKLMKKLHAMLFTGRTVTLALEPLTNFAVQRLLKNIKEKEDFEDIFTELVDHIKEILDAGHIAVVMEMASTCLRLGCKQNQMVMGLQTAFHIAKDKEKLKYFLLCLVKMKPYEKVIEDKSTQVNLHGSLIVQSILKYNKPIVMINSIMDVSADQLMAIVQTPNGSHIVDAFMNSKFVGEKSREKLIRHLEGFYIDLAMSKHGSRVIEQLFNAAQDPQKARIAKELSDKCNMLKSTPFGQGICSKLRIETYRLSAAQWKSNLQQKEDKVQQLFKDIVN